MISTRSLELVIDTVYASHLLSGRPCQVSSGAISIYFLCYTCTFLIRTQNTIFTLIDAEKTGDCGSCRPRQRAGLIDGNKMGIAVGSACPKHSPTFMAR